MAFGFGKATGNYKGGNSYKPQAQKSVGTIILSVVAAFVVFQFGKTLGMLVVQIILPLVCPELFTVSDAAAEEMLQQEMMGATLQDVLNGTVSLAMQFMAGLVCFLIWRKELCWKKKDASAVSGETAAAVENAESADSSGAEKKRPYWLRVLAFAGLAIFTCLGLNLIMNGLQLTMLSEVFMEAAEVQASVPVIMGVLMFAIVAPLSEEILFRGIIYGKMRGFFGAAKALPIAALFFGVYHGNIIQGLYAGVIGALLCFVYEKAGSLWAAVLFHGIGNLAVYLLIDVYGVMDMLGNPVSVAVGVVMCGLAVGAFFLCFGRNIKLD